MWSRGQLAATVISKQTLALSILEKLAHLLLPDVHRSLRFWNLFIPIHIRYLYTKFRHSESRGEKWEVRWHWYHSNSNSVWFLVQRPEATQIMTYLTIQGGLQDFMSNSLPNRNIPNLAEQFLRFWLNSIDICWWCECTILLHIQSCSRSDCMARFHKWRVGHLVDTTFSEQILLLLSGTSLSCSYLLHDEVACSWQPHTVYAAMLW